MEWSKINLHEERYQYLTTQNIDPPVEQLYVSGEIPNLKESIAVVGSRKISEYGKRVCRDFVSSIAEAGLTVVSGLMYGVDLEAHNAAIDAGGRTVGVLGYGHNHIKKYGYGASLCRKILDLKAGAIVSEYHPDQPAAKWTFPQRNRIISGLSCAVLIIEAGEHSGSLITAGYAAEQGKEVFVIPGSIYSLNSRGTNWLIKQGAHMATSPEDILSYFDKEVGTKSRQVHNLSDFERKIIEIIETLDNLAFPQKIAQSLGYAINEVSVKISELELAGYIKRDSTGRFSVKI